MATTLTPRIPTLRMAAGVSNTPIIENPKLAVMKGNKPVLRRIGGKIIQMPETPAAVSGSKVMKPVPANPTPTPVTDRRDQQALPQEPSAGQPSSVRLRVRITQGVASVVGAHVVPGEMPAPERLDYGLAYEVRIGDRRVAVGSVPDVGMRRSYPDPDRRPGMEGHHLQELDVIEVNLRLPQREFTAAALGKLNVQMFRMKGQAPAQALTPAPLMQQFPQLLRPAAELRGIKLEALAPALRSRVESALFVRPTPLRSSR